MTTAALLPHVTGLAGALRRHGAQLDWQIDQHRSAFESAATTRQLADGVRVESVSTPGGAAEWMLPNDQVSDEVIVYLHGGGFVMGSLSTSRPMATHLAAATRRRVLVLGYSLAPEARYPVQVNEILRCHAWLLADGYSPTQIVLCGDSAGAALAVSAMVQMRDSGVPLPAAVVLLSPLLDFRLTAGSIDSSIGLDPQTPRWLLERMVSSYLGAVDPSDPRINPALADIRGLPPLLIQVTDCEGLRDDARAFYQSARESGVDAELDVWRGLLHVWHNFAPRLPEAVQALEAVGAWLDGLNGSVRSASVERCHRTPD